MKETMNFQIVDLFRWDYLVVDCGYISRLANHSKHIISQTEDDLMFFMDNNYDPKTKKTTYFKIEVEPDVDGVYDTLVELAKEEKLSIRGAVCFNWGGYYDDADLLDLLISYNHCGCFSDRPSVVASFTTHTGKKVLYKQFDTESG